MTARPSWQYLKGYRDGAKTGPGYDHVTIHGVERLLRGEYHYARRDDEGAYWRGYGAGYIAKIIGIDFSGGCA